MKKSFYIVILMCLLVITGCNRSEQSVTSNTYFKNDDARVFVSGMGCSNPNCTDQTHYHDCPIDCQDYSHYHNCNLDCNDASHHHTSSTENSNVGHHSQNKHHNSNHY